MDTQIKNSNVNCDNQSYQSLMLTAKTDEEALRRLIEIVKVLRSNCPWDKVQTHESLRSCLIEEAYETAEAIDNNDQENLEEELGDVLLQIVFQSRIGEENDKFNLNSVINGECDKMIRRHPHVFYKETIKTVDKTIEKWENIKRKEDGDIAQSVRLASVPKALPALIRSYKIQEKAAEVGFDWDDVSYAFQKVKEETEELMDVCRRRDDKKMVEELGDLLFAVVNVARFLKVNPEQALNFTSEKFTHRFTYIENQAALMGKKPEDMLLIEMDKLWEDAKKLER